MLKRSAQILFMLSMTTSALAAAEESVKRVVRRSDIQASQYLARGLNVGLEYSAISLKGELAGGTTMSWDRTFNLDSASAVGTSVSYVNFDRGGLAWSAGASIVNKVENNSNSSTSLGASGNILQVRPEANLGYAFRAGFWGMLGGHVSHMSGSTDVEDFIEPFGGGIQATMGYVFRRNFGGDIGYYVSAHHPADTYIDRALINGGSTINKEKSWLIFNQLRARVSYYF